MATVLHTRARLMTITDAAKYMGMGRSAFYNLINTGKIPTVTVNHTRRIDRRDLRVYIARHKTKPT